MRMRHSPREPDRAPAQDGGKPASDLGRRRMVGARRVAPPPPGAVRPGGRRQRFGVWLERFGAAAIVLAVVLGPLSAGSLGLDALLAYPLERVAIGLVGIAAAATGWVLCGSDDIR